MEPAKWWRTVCMLMVPLFLSAALIGSASSTRKILHGSDPSSAVSGTQLTQYLTWLKKAAAKKHAPASASSSSTALFFTSAATNASTSVVITVSQSGSADFSSVQDAVDSVSSGNSQRVVIQIAAGTYKEKVNVPSSKPYISFIGAGSKVTTITWDDTATSAGSTFKSASVIVDSDYFIARDISFVNTAPAPPPGAEGRQAVALRISGDKAAFYSCGFYGAQDTLYDHQGRHYFQGCFIQGSIDFIFGNGQSYYDGCELHSIANSTGSLTAQNRASASEDTGFLFVSCTVTGSGVVYLGRAWGAYSRVVYLNTYMDDIINPVGWNDWGVSSREKTVFYGEYQCSGPGSNSTDRVSWSHQLTAAQAAPFETISFIDGASWLES